MYMTDRILVKDQQLSSVSTNHETALMVFFAASGYSYLTQSTRIRSAILPSQVGCAFEGTSDAEAGRAPASNCTDLLFVAASGSAWCHRGPARGAHPDAAGGAIEPMESRTI